MGHIPNRFLGVPEAATWKPPKPPAASRPPAGTRKAVKRFRQSGSMLPRSSALHQEHGSDGPASPKDILPRGEAGVFRFAATDMWAGGIERVPCWRPKAVNSPLHGRHGRDSAGTGQGKDSVSRGEGWRVLFGVPPIQAGRKSETPLCFRAT